MKLKIVVNPFIKRYMLLELDTVHRQNNSRFDRASTIFCTLYKKEEWIPRLGKGTFAESIYERFAAHDSIVIDTGDMNMREIFKNGTKRDVT